MLGHSKKQKIPYTAPQSTRRERIYAFRVNAKSSYGTDESVPYRVEST